MGWKDDPPVDPDGAPKWASDPAVGDVAEPQTEGQYLGPETETGPRINIPTGPARAMSNAAAKTLYAIPSLAGLDAATAEAFLQALQDRASGGTDDLWGRFKYLKPAYSAAYKKAQQESPYLDAGASVLATIPTIAAAAPAAALRGAPEAIKGLGQLVAPSLTGLSRGQQAVALGKSGAATGAILASGQPSDSAWEKAQNMGTAALFGGGLGAATGAVMPPLSAGAVAGAEFQRAGLPVSLAPPVRVGSGPVAGEGPLAGAGRIAEAVFSPPPGSAGSLPGRLAEAATAPTGASELLASHGVKLTLGQARPKSWWNQLEEASTSLPVQGSAIKAQRDAPKFQLQRVMLNLARPPGMKQLHGEGPVVPEELETVYKAFGPAYDAVKGVDVYPAIHADGNGIPLQTLGKSVGAFDRAVANPDVLADANTRGVAKAFLDNQITKLPEREGALGTVPVENMLSMRHEIRGAIRSANHQNKPELAQILGEAEDAVTQAMESQLPAEWAQSLRAVDAKYAQFKVVSQAMTSAMDSPLGFTPRQVSSAIAGRMSGDRFATGGGDVLRDLARAGRESFEMVSPPTGARLITLATSRTLGNLLTAPAVLSANRPATASTLASPATRAALPGTFGGRMASPAGAPAATATSAPGPSTQEQRSTASAAPSHSSPSSAQAIIARVAEDPKLRPYSEAFQRAEAAGPGTAAALHFELYAKDPTYRQAVTAKEAP